MEWKDEDFRSSHFEEKTQKCIIVDNRRVTIFPKYRRKRPSSRWREKTTVSVEEERRSFGGCRHSSWKTRSSRRVDDSHSSAAMPENDSTEKVASAKEKEMVPLLEYEETDDDDDIARSSQLCGLDSDEHRSFTREQFRLQKSPTVARSTRTEKARLFKAAKHRSLRDIGTSSSHSTVSSSGATRSHERTARSITEKPFSSDSKASGVDSTYVAPFFQAASSQPEESANTHATWNQSAFLRLTRIVRFLRVMRPNGDANANPEMPSSAEAPLICQSAPQISSSASRHATDRTELEEGGFYKQNLSLGLQDRDKLKESKSESSLKSCHPGPSDCKPRSPFVGASVSSSTKLNRPTTEDSKLRFHYDSHHPHHRGLHHDVAAAYFLGRCQVPLSTSQQLLKYGKTFLAFLFSTIGLTFLLVGYTIIGGFLFRALEAPNETQVRSNMLGVRTEYIKRLWELTEALNVLHPVNWSEMAEALLANYTTEVYLATKKLGWDGKDLGETERQWSFAGSLLFSITVITTIGRRTKASPGP